MQPGAMLRLRNFWWKRPAKLSPAWKSFSDDGEAAPALQGEIAFAVLAYHRLGWRGPRAVYASLAGFTTLVLSRFAVDLFFHSFHTFR